MGMTREQYLLTKLAEEASEVAQIALKTQQFGLDEVYIDDSNRVRLHGELNDLLTIVSMLNQECNLRFSPNPEHGKKKIDKVNKYYLYSMSLDKVEYEDQDQKVET